MLITGTKGYLGKFLQDKLKCYDHGLHRNTTIIHCAANLTHNINTYNLYQYYCDNIKLTEQLCSLSHDLFILISSIDVYPKEISVEDVYCKDAWWHAENEKINLKDVSTFYGQTKLIEESIVQNQSKNYVIIRISSPFGTKPNSITKIIDNQPIFITASSSLNCILNDDIYTLIKYIIDNNIKNEIFNLVASNNVSMSQIARMYDKPLQIYGNYYNTPGNINGSKVYNILPELNKTSMENITRWINENRNT